jgi:uncharacterized membrane protein YhaH (DUF805 family)
MKGCIGIRDFWWNQRFFWGISVGFFVRGLIELGDTGGSGCCWGKLEAQASKRIFFFFYIFLFFAKI